MPELPIGLESKFAEIEKLNAETHKLVAEHDWRRTQQRSEPFKIIVYSVAATLAAIGVFVTILEYFFRQHNSRQKTGRRRNRAWQMC